ncbi:MAG: TrbC/VirB2 family protein [Patescibacteria group bacterium]|nr:TrbC/VirB2 family protein [Patescibacteria group bacterium]MDE2590159.1 TrbC/VirB2 family protein [Patescibacteria group bacterium]
MKKLLINATFFVATLLFVTPAFAQTATTTSGNVSQIVTFIQSIVQVLITLAGTVSVGFFVWGGFGYITSSGHPDNLDRSKKTILYSAVGLAIVLGAFVFSGIVSQLATAAFGATH